MPTVNLNIRPMQHGKTKLMLSAADLFINEPPHSANIFNEEYELPPNAPRQLGRSVKISNYRKLPWTITNKYRSSSIPQATSSTVSARKNMKKVMAAVDSSEEENVTECIRKLKSADFHRINLESRSILNNGHMAWKHANEVKVKLGISCIFFNNPEFFKHASEVFAKEYELRCTKEEKKREDWERTRSILHSTSKTYKAGRPSLCAPPTRSADNLIRLPPPKLLENREQQSSRSTVANKLLFESHPWKKNAKDADVEENFDSGLSDIQTSIIEVFDDAERLISNHLGELQKKYPVELLPIVLPKLTEAQN